MKLTSVRLYPSEFTGTDWRSRLSCTGSLVSKLHPRRSWEDTEGSIAVGINTGGIELQKRELSPLE